MEISGLNPEPRVDPNEPPPDHAFKSRKYMYFADITSPSILQCFRLSPCGICANVSSSITDTHVMQLVRLLYDFGMVDFLLKSVSQCKTAKHAQEGNLLHVNVDRVLDVRIFARHFVVR